MVAEIVVQPAPQYLPAGQDVQVDVVPEPKVEYDPGGHIPHAGEAVLAEIVVQPSPQYLPAGQDVQVDVVTEHKDGDRHIPHDAQAVVAELVA